MTHTENTNIVLPSLQARQSFWIEKRDRARLAKNNQAAGDAQTLIDEYDALIDILKHRSNESPQIGYWQARR
jgi:hypothetical protein